MNDNILKVQIALFNIFREYTFVVFVPFDDIFRLCFNDLERSINSDSFIVDLNGKVQSRNLLLLKFDTTV